MSTEKKPMDPFQRGKKGFNATGSVVLTVGRLANIALQLAILGTPLLDPMFRQLGRARLLPSIAPSVGSVLSPALLLGALPAPRLVLLGLNALLALKQTYWAWRISLEPVGAGTGVEVSAINAAIDTLLAGLYLGGVGAGGAGIGGEDERLTPSMLAAAAVYVLGSAAELVSERQRRAFKDDPRNRGRLFTGGLFRYARHVNYGGFAIARTAHALFAAGWKAALPALAFFTWDLGFRAAGILDEYCGKRVFYAGITNSTAVWRAVGLV